MAIHRNVWLAAGLLLAAGCLPAAADDIWHTTRALLPGDVVRDDDVTSKSDAHPAQDAVPAAREVAGLEVKRRVFAGRPLTVHDVGPRSAVRANTTVTVLWRTGALSLELQGRAMEDGAIGDEIRVLNPASLRTIRGTVVGDGMIEMRTEQ
jgi:flagella basal body P-ring formation protein FlgA